MVHSGVIADGILYAATIAGIVHSNVIADGILYAANIAGMVHSGVIADGIPMLLSLLVWSTVVSLQMESSMLLALLV